MPAEFEEEESSNQSNNSSAWSREEDKLFERAIARHYPPRDDDLLSSSEDRWLRIAACVPGKSVEEIKRHYEVLVDDVSRIESGFVEVPCYTTSSSDGSCGGGGGRKRGGKSEQEQRRKGIAWTEDEHRSFLLGLEKYGKGDWRSISRNFVVTRTPTQVASHAQKYFIRLNSSINKDRRRSSIHDITSVGSQDVSLPDAPSQM